MSYDRDRAKEAITRSLKLSTGEPDPAEMWFVMGLLGGNLSAAMEEIERLGVEAAFARNRVPEGYTLVPLDPTDEMLRHFIAELQGEVVNIFRPDPWWGDIQDAYRDMLRVAPKP